MFDKLLVAIDLSLTEAQAVLRRALELSSGTSEIWVIHVVEPQYVQYSIDPTFSGRVTRAMEEQAASAPRGRLAEICAPFDIPEDHQLIELGRAADRIHDRALERLVDCIVVGSHARSGLARLLGSTANAVLHGAPVNVMTVRIT